MFPSPAQALAGIALSLGLQADRPQDCTTFSISKLPVLTTGDPVGSCVLGYLLLVFKDFLLFCFTTLFSYI